MSGPPAVEVNFDGLVGPTHNYAGLSPGNLASQRSRRSESNPRAAALQGIAKMRLMVALGVPQGVLPPQERPDLAALRRLGFEGDEARVLRDAAREAPDLLAACSSASAMWAANAATVCPSADAADGRVHLTPANLVSTLHRALEAPATARALRAIFRDPERFAHHPPLTASTALGDEGAANHERMCVDVGDPGVQLLVHGRPALGGDGPPPRHHPARQSAAASRTLARLHGLDPARIVLAQQHPDAIDAGAFHDDVVAVAHRDLLLVHEHAWLGQDGVVARLREAFVATCGREPRVVEVPSTRLSLDEAVRSYLFNSQVVTAGDGRRVLVAPAECDDISSAADVLDELTGSGAVDEVRIVDIRQSMRNGGGPACLRLRVVLTEAERAGVAPGAMVDEAALDRLEAWVRRHHRDRLSAADLGDPSLLAESRAALDDLTRLLGLGNLHEFQRG